MNLYEFEGKTFFAAAAIAIPKGEIVVRWENAEQAIGKLAAQGVSEFVAKAQVLSGKRGKNNGIRFCDSLESATAAVADLFRMQIRDQYVASVYVEQKLAIAEEHYLSISYDTNVKMPVLVYSKEGGVDIEDVPEEKIERIHLDIREENVLTACCAAADAGMNQANAGGVDLKDIPFAQALWDVFRKNDCRVAEVNPLVKTVAGEWVAADSKVAIDADAFFRHEEWKELEPRTMMGRPPTDREIAVMKIDAGDKYYQGTAGKYIEMDGDIGLILIGGGASIANMDALQDAGLQAANYTEYSGNPPREKVYELTKLVLSKPGLRGLWIAGVVSNFTNVQETFMGTADALAEVMPTYPIVVRRDGPFGKEGKAYFMNFAKEKGLNIHWFGKETSMTETASVLADMVNKHV